MDDDYRRLVHDVQTAFLSGVRKNLRGRLLLNPFKNYWMAVSWKLLVARRQAEASFVVPTARGHRSGCSWLSHAEYG